MELEKPQIIEKIDKKLTIHIYDIFNEGVDLPEKIYGFIHTNCKEEMLLKESTLKKIAKLLK